MKNKLKTILLAVSFAAASAPAFAQVDSVLIQSAQFVGDLNIFLRDANKISNQPFVIETETNASLMKYNMLPTRLISFTQPATILSSNFPMEKKLKKLQNGWIDVSFGSYVTPKVDAYYTDGRSKKGDWGILYGHQSSNSNFEVLSGADLPTTFSDNHAALWGKRFYKKTVADAKFNWNRNVTNWYGIDSSQQYVADYSALKQTMSVYSGNFGIHTFDRDSNDLNWWGKAGYRLASDAYNSNEHFVDVSGGASKLVKTEVFSGEFGITYNKFNSTGLDWSADYANTWGEGDSLRSIRTFDNAICIVDEFQNLTKQQLQMVLSRLGKGSIMILTGDRYQVDLKFNNDSAVHEVPKIKNSIYVNEIILTDNHRHEALEEILNLLNEKY